MGVFSDAWHNFSDKAKDVMGGEDSSIEHVQSPWQEEAWKGTGQFRQDLYAGKTPYDMPFTNPEFQQGPSAQGALTGVNAPNYQGYNVGSYNPSTYNVGGYNTGGYNVGGYDARGYNTANMNTMYNQMDTMYDDARNQYDERMGAMGIAGGASTGPSGSYAAGLGRQEAQIASDKWNNMMPMMGMQYQAQNEANRYGADMYNQQGANIWGSQVGANRYGADMGNQANRDIWGSQVGANRYGAESGNQAGRDIWGANMDQSRYMSDYGNQYQTDMWNAGGQENMMDYNRGITGADWNTNLGVQNYNNELQRNIYQSGLENQYSQLGMGETYVNPGMPSAWSQFTGMVGQGILTAAKE